MDLSENEELTLSSYGDFRRENDDKGVEWGALFLDMVSHGFLTGKLNHYF